MASGGNDNKWKELELLIASFQSVGKAQSHYVSTLLAYLFLVWVWHSFSPTAQMRVQVLGITLEVAGLWPITPGIACLLNLGLTGSMNAHGAVHQRLSKKLTELGKEMFFTDLDTNKNILDYIRFLRLRPEGELQPGTPLSEDQKYQKHQIGVFLYSALIAGGVLTTCYAYSFLPKTAFYCTYSLACLGAQLLFFPQIFWRAFCRFFGLRREQLRRVSR